jgi:S-DNA-T family DNA segregation ATPase FtsK/SpoIIIE
LVRILSHIDKKVPVAADIGASLSKGFRELLFLALAAIALLYLISLVTFNLEDAGWTHTGSARGIVNAAGSVGAWVSDFSFSMIGVVAFVLPLMVAVYGHSIYKSVRPWAFRPFASLFRLIGLALTIVSGSALADIHLEGRLPLELPQTAGGILGQEITQRLLADFGLTGTSVLLAASLLVGISLCTGVSWLVMVDAMGKYTLWVANGFFSVFQGMGHASAREPATEPLAAAKKDKAKPAKTETAAPSSPNAKATPLGKNEPAQSTVKANKLNGLAPVQPGELPPLDLLNQKASKTKGYSREDLDKMSRLLEGILDDFGVEVEVVDVLPGPVITRFEIQPAPGVKASRISGLAKDLARALSLKSVRVVEIIPGKSVIGLEVPNEEREIVLLHSVLASDLYQQAESPLTMVLGKDISGEPVVANLAKMPHLLVAGTTGSGKSVAVNVMILSMLYKAGPDQVRMIMIDPKMLELSIYEGIPHLLTPVVTDMKEAANALRWSVAEMERRYKLMSMLGVRNLAGYNQKIRDGLEANEPVLDPLWSPNMAVSEDEGPPPLGHLPLVVIIIDELADMMMIVGKKVEELIARLAQKARAAGIHLVLATQRPSVDVLTGLIKANIPTRLSFQVSSRIDSRTIIDQGGAETLLGNGDMLFLPPGSGIPMRAHGAFVSDQEVHNVVEFLKRTGKPDYIEEITRFSEDGPDFGGSSKGSNGGGDGGEESDALYDEAVRFVTESRKASISSVQRRFKVGYNRAARMIEDMEKAGIVGPAETNGSRTVLAPPPAEV